jgi:hypothetical protein
MMFFMGPIHTTWTGPVLSLTVEDRVRFLPGREDIFGACFV